MKNQDSMVKSELLIGQDGLAKLANSTVMVFGLGGVGSSCVEALARGGIGNLILIDHDVVSPSNINRQRIAFNSTVGQRKIDVMRAMIADINPRITVSTHDQFVLPENLPELFDVRPDYVIDAIDTISTKLALAQYADEQGIPLVSSMGAGNKFHPGMLEFADIHDTSVCPLCRVVRKEARIRGIKQLHVLYSRENPVKVEAKEGAARSERSDLGTISFMPPIMGLMLAGEVIRTLLGIEDPQV
ncbi:MAG: tRNA threonylcarbamoyladenosine dehydratase [Actinobacteria bacterium]|nr:tRNA threonylcarbamoyladenosine dehydratase [Actinomycetota bacterium]